MKQINTSDYIQIMEAHQWDLDGRSLVSVMASGENPVILELMTEEKEKIIVAAGQQLNFRRGIDGFTALILRSVSPFGAKVEVRSQTPKEPFNPQPIPEPERPQNILQKIRHRVRQESGAQREQFLESRRYSPYELEEETPDEFEEDIYERSKEQSQPPEIATDAVNAPPEAPPSPTPETGADGAPSGSSDPSSTELR